MQATHRAIVGACLFLASWLSAAPSPASEFRALGVEPAGSDRERGGDAFVITPNGSHVVGRVCESAALDALCVPVLVAADGAKTLLEPLPGHAHAHAWEISANGRVVVGYSAESSSGASTAVRWVGGGVAMPIGAPGIDSMARFVTPDGRLIAGYATTADGSKVLFAWTEAAGMVPLVPEQMRQPPWSRLNAPSDVGEIAFDLHPDWPASDEFVPARWSGSDGLRVLAPTPPGYLFSSILQMARSTGAVLGNAYSDLISGSAGLTRLSSLAWRSTEGGLLEPLALPAPYSESRAGVMSRDGRTVVGDLIRVESGQVEFDAVRWSDGSSYMLLGAPPDGFSDLGLHGVTDRGEVVWGSMFRGESQLVYAPAHAPDVYDARLERRPILLFEDGRRLDLPHATFLIGAPCDHDLSTSLTDTTADGSLVVGQTDCHEPDVFQEVVDEDENWSVVWTKGPRHQERFVWDPASGYRTVNDYIEQEHGVDVSGWDFRYPRLNDAGTLLYGSGFHDGASEAFVLYVPEPAARSSLASVLVVLAWLARMRPAPARWRRAPHASR